MNRSILKLLFLSLSTTSTTKGHELSWATSNNAATVQFCLAVGGLSTIIGFGIATIWFNHKIGNQLTGIRTSIEEISNWKKDTTTKLNNLDQIQTQLTQLYQKTAVLLESQFNDYQKPTPCSLQNELTLIKTEQTQLMNQVAQLGNSYNILKNRLDEYNKSSALEKVTNSITMLKAQIQEQDKTRDQLKEQITELTSTSNTLKARLDNETSKNLTLDVEIKRISACENEIKQLKDYFSTFLDSYHTIYCNAGVTNWLNTNNLTSKSTPSSTAPNDFSQLLKTHPDTINGLILKLKA